MSFLAELKRRKLVQVLAVYTVTAWLLMQIAATIQEPLRLPDWFTATVIVVLAIGLPVTLVMAWAYDLTPDGVVRDQGDRAPRRHGYTIEIVLGVLLVLTVGWIAILQMESGAPPNSIAVLPFDNLSPDPDNRFVASGLQQEITASLNDISGLDVLPPAAVRRYEIEKPSPEQMAEALNVAYLLDGSLRVVGSQMRIQIYLIDAGGNTVWDEAYDAEKEVETIIDTQLDIAANLTEKMQVEFSLDDEARISIPPTSSYSALEKYWRAREFWNERTDDAVEQATRLYREALEEDPNFARPHAGLADVYIARGWYSILAPDDAYPQAKQQAELALEIDPNLAEAYASLGNVAVEFEHDWDVAEMNFLQAIELDERYATAHQWYGGLLSATGRHQEALEQALRARELDEYAPIISTWVGLRYYFDDRYDDAITVLERVRDEHDTFAPGLWHLGMAYEQVDRFDEAISVAQDAYRLTRNHIYLASVGHSHAMAGNEAEARRVLDELNRIAADGQHVSPYHVATIYVALGAADDAFEWLDIALDGQEPWVAYLRVDPRLDPVRGDPSFDDLLRRADLDF